MTIPSNSYTNVFGGTPVQPSSASYLSYTLSQALTTLSWPIQFQDTNNLTANIMNVVSLEDGYNLALPNATYVGNGTTLLVFNTGAHPFNLVDSGLITISPVPASAAYMFILIDNTTARGRWIIDPFGGGTLSVTSIAATAPTQGFTITGSPITTSGTLVFALNDDLLALEDLSTTGIAVRTADSTWTTRELTTANTNLSITDPDGVSGNPLLTVGPNLTGLTTVSSNSVAGGNISISGNTISSTSGGVTIAPLINTNASLTTTGTGYIGLNGISIDSTGNITNITNLTLNNITVVDTLTTSGFVIGTTLVSTVNSPMYIFPFANGTSSAQQIILGTANGISILCPSVSTATNQIKNVGSLSFGSGATFSLSYTGTIATTAGGISIVPAINNNLSINTTGTGTINLKNISIDQSNNITGVSNLTVNGTMVATQVAKAFASISYNGSSVTILSSFNIGSIVGNNGAFTITFSSPIANMCPVISPIWPAGSTGSDMLQATITSTTPPNTMSVRLFRWSGSGINAPTSGSFSFVVF